MNHTPGNAEPQLGSRLQSTDHPAKVWYSRGYLPHCDQMGLLQSITFRLADSLPQEKLKQLEETLKVVRSADEGNAELGLGTPSIPGRRREWQDIEVEKRKRIESWLDSGMGCCALRHPKMAQVTQETLLIFDGKKYRLLAWCIMPNHVHVLISHMICAR